MLATRKNLLLAWNRIGAGKNIQYKRYFRHIYNAYAIALEANINELYKRLRWGSFVAQKPIRLFVPKPSGLHRPLTLLHLEDQIVLQAVTNVFVRRLANRRRAVELKSVFSNVLDNGKDSIFFLRDWHLTYQVYSRRLKELFQQGFCWVAEFDLAAYYDTISHDLLLRTAFPRGGFNEFCVRIQNWLSIWSAETSSVRHGHGIPQGPIASDFLAECFLLPIDEAMGKRCKYLRYVDDIRILGHSEKEIRVATIDLELLCRNRGLIPQAKKIGIHRVASADELLSFVPSIALSSDEAGERYRLSDNKAILEFRKSLGGRPLRIKEKSRARFVLYHAKPSKRLIRYVLALLPHHPEHIDAFLNMLKMANPDKRIIDSLNLIYS